MQDFSFSTVKTIINELGCCHRQLGVVAKSLAITRVLIVTDAGIVKSGMIEPALASLTAAGVASVVYTDVVADPPEAVVERAVAFAREQQIDGVIGLGGGSSMDVAKIIALLTNSVQTLQQVYGVNNATGNRLPLIQIPTTAGTGSLRATATRPVARTAALTPTEPQNIQRRFCTTRRYRDVHADPPGPMPALTAIAKAALPVLMLAGGGVAWASSGGASEPTGATQAWVEHEYHRRLHSEIGTTPLDRLLNAPNVGRPSPSVDVLRRAFRREVSRTQRRSDGTITVEGVRFEMPSRFRPLTRPTIRYASWDLSNIDLVDPRHETHLATLLPLDKLKNATGARRVVTPVDPRPAPASGIAAHLDQLMREYAATGLPPAYVSLDERRASDTDEHQGDVT